MKEWEANHEMRHWRVSGTHGEKKAKQAKDDYDVDLNTCSAMDCTGLIPSLPQSEEEMENYENLYHYTAQSYVKDENSEG